MASNLECVGLSVEGRAWKRLLRDVQRDGVEQGGRADGAVVRWDDPSGARLLLETWNDAIVNLVPSYAGEPGVWLSGLEPYGSALFVTNVVDGSGATVAKLALELEDRLEYAEVTTPVSGRAALIALGTDVDVRGPDDEAEDETTGDEDSDDEDSDDEEAADAVEDVDADRGEAGAAGAAFKESLSSTGLDPNPQLAEPIGHLSGSVIRVEQRKVEATGREFVVARVRVSGVELDLCMSADEFAEPPQPGDTVDGTVYLVATFWPEDASKPAEPEGARAGKATESETDPGAATDDEETGTNAVTDDVQDDTDADPAGADDPPARPAGRRSWWARLRGRR